MLLFVRMSSHVIPTMLSSHSGIKRENCLYQTHPEPLGHRGPTSLGGKLDPQWPRGLDVSNPETINVQQKLSVI